MKALTHLSDTKNRWIIVLSIMLLSGCSPSSQKVEAEHDHAEHNHVDEKATTQENRKLSPAQAYEMMHTDSEFIVLDVRTPEEFEAGHIDEAINIDFRSEAFKDNLQKLDKKKTYLVYCMGGHRSNQAQILMDSLDFKVYDLMGGFRQWSAADLPDQ